MQQTSTLTFISTSPEMTRRVGAALAAVLEKSDTIGLTGELGAGKTVFVQGLAQGLRVESSVTSPTFVLMHLYKGPVPLVHIDLYRLSSAQAEELGLDEYLADAIGVIEWVERLTGLDVDLQVSLSFLVEPEKRLVQLEALSSRGQTILQQLKQNPAFSTEVLLNGS